MFRLAACDLKARRIMLIEDHQDTADAISASVEAQGGRVVAETTTVADALEIASTFQVDTILVHVRYVAGLDVAIPDLFRPHGIDVQFLACFDEWFDLDEDAGDGDRRSISFR